MTTPTELVFTCQSKGKPCYEIRYQKEEIEKGLLTAKKNCTDTGTIACNLYDDSYMFLLPGNSMGFAVNSGRIAGKEASAYIQR